MHRAKFLPPALSGAAVSRHALLERTLASDARIITIVAPGGSGKSIFASELFNALDTGEGRRACWMHVDAYDDGLAFWLYLCESIQTVHPDQDFSWIIKGNDGILPWINILINQLAQLDGVTTLFIDNYQFIHANEVHHELKQLITYLPASIRIVLISRNAIPFSLSKQRVGGELFEIDDADLAFSYEETVDCLAAAGRHVDRSDAWACYSLTRGWVAGVKIMALSQDWGDDAKSFSDSEELFAFFSDEVLDALEPEAREFLVTTSFLSDLNPALCDHVLERDDSAKMLMSLAKSGLFISELGGAEGWYRLHPLLQDVLFSRFKGSVPLLLRRSARRAGEWFEEQGDLASALSCYALTEDYQRLLSAAEIYALNVGYRASSSTALLNLLESVPAAEFYGHPAMAVAYAAALFSGGAIGKLDEFMLNEDLIFGEGGLDASPEDERLYIVRALWAYGHMDYAKAHEEIGKARKACDESAFSLMGLLFFLDSRCLVGLGRWDDALAALKHSAWNAHHHQMGEEYLMAMNELSRVQASCGKVRDAEATLMSGLQYASRHNLESDAVSFARFSMAFAKREMCEIDSFVETEKQLGTFITEQMQRFSGWLFAPDFFLELARCYVYVRDFEMAAACLASSKDVIKRHLDIPLLPQQTVIARLMVWLSRGEMERVENWRMAHESRTFTGTAAGARELDTLCRAMALIAADKPARLLAFLEEELPDVEAIPTFAHRIDYRILKAWAHLQLGQTDQARQSMLAALRLGRNGGYLRHFVDWGPWHVPLLSSIAADLPPKDDFFRYVSAVRDNTEKFWKGAKDVPAWQQQRSQIGDAQLSAREMEVLRLLVERKTVSEIAEACHVSRNTAQTHVRNIYSKLGVHSRIEAIQIGQTLIDD